MAVDESHMIGGASTTPEASDAAAVSNSATGGGVCLDYIETPLNACSLETFCHHHVSELDSKDPNSSSSSSETESSFIPLCLGCYQLNESTGKREGRLDLYAVPVHSDDGAATANEKDDIKTFGAKTHPPLTILGGGGEDGETREEIPGVLDGKWSNRPRWLSHSSSRCDRGFQNYYATAHANGEIWVHDIRSSNDSNVVDGSESPSSNPVPRQQHPFEAKMAGKSLSPSSNEGLCLALAWENPLYGSNDDSSNNNGVFDTRIISSYSDGHTAIHRVRERTSCFDETNENNNDNDENNTPLEMTLEHHWDSHKIFTCPAEVWCANFIDSNTVVTGGDEGSWKVWDLRQPLLTHKPVYHGKNYFDAGVTVLAPHPRHDKLLAIGSYDETIALFDLRKTTAVGANPKALYHSESLGAGIWRCKWHPFEDHKLLVAAMHGGGVVGEFEGLQQAAACGGTTPEVQDAVVRFEIKKEFKLHQSMAYGIDWLVSGSKPPRGKAGVDVAASCSFYDKSMYLWKTGSS
jgi:diphthamide biosynthesis protein 7